MMQQPLEGQVLLIVEVSRSHSDTPHSVGILSTSDQPNAEPSAWLQTTLTRDRHHAPSGIRTRNHSKRETTDARFSLRGLWDRI